MEPPVPGFGILIGNHSICHTFAKQYSTACAAKRLVREIKNPHISAGVSLNKKQISN